METMTTEEVQKYIAAARNSVTVITEQLQKLSDGAAASEEIKGNIERNVEHLEIVVARQEVIDSGEDISDLQQAVASGKAKLEENIWG